MLRLGDNISEVLYVARDPQTEEIIAKDASEGYCIKMAELYARRHGIPLNWLVVEEFDEDE